MNSTALAVSTIPSIFARNGNVSSLPLQGSGSVDFKNGFGEKYGKPLSQNGIYPRRSDFNALGKIGTSLGWFSQCGGIHTFNKTVCNAIGGYPYGSILSFYEEDKNLLSEVVSLVQNNKVDFTEAGVDGINWAYVNSAESNGMFPNYNPLQGELIFARRSTTIGDRRVGNVWETTNGITDILNITDIKSTTTKPSTSENSNPNRWVTIPRDGWLYVSLLGNWDAKSANAELALVVGPSNGDIPNVEQDSSLDSNYFNQNYLWIDIANAQGDMFEQICGKCIPVSAGVRVALFVKGGWTYSSSSLSNQIRGYLLGSSTDYIPPSE